MRVFGDGPISRPPISMMAVCSRSPRIAFCTNSPIAPSSAARHHLARRDGVEALLQIEARKQGHDRVGNSVIPLDPIFDQPWVGERIADLVGAQRRGIILGAAVVCMAPGEYEMVQPGLIHLDAALGR